MTESLGELQTLVEADGGALELLGVDETDSAVRLGLKLEGAECAECVMPRDYLEMLSLDILRRSLPELAKVSIDDPRES